MKTNLTFTAVIAAMLVSIFSIHVKAQDLIVKERGDSLNCKIIDIKRDSIYFVITKNNEMLIRVLSMGRVQHYKKYFFTNLEREKAKGAAVYPKFRIGVQFGSVSKYHLKSKKL